MKTHMIRMLSPILAVALVALAACSHGCAGGSANKGAAVATGISTSVGLVANLAECSEQAKGPLAGYLAGNLDNAEPLIAGAKTGAIVKDVLCALQAIAGAIPGYVAAGNLAAAPPAAPAGPPSAAPGAPVKVPVVGPSEILTVPGAGAPGIVAGAPVRGALPVAGGAIVDPSRASRALRIMRGVCGSGVKCENARVDLSACVEKESGREAKPGEKLCP